MKIAGLVFALASLTLACGGSKSSPAGPQPPATEAHAHAGSGAMGGMCPMEVPGTHVSAEDTADGVAVVFKTTGDVAQLRERVHAMAAMHEHMMTGGGMMGSGSGGMMMKMVPSTARAEDSDSGARIVLTPNDPARLAELRQHVHAHAEMMASGHCPMMQHGT